MVCPGGQKRKALPTPEAWMYLLNPLQPVNAPKLKLKGTGYGNDALKAKRAGEKKRRVAAAPPQGTMVPTKNASGARLSEAQLRKRAAPSGTALPQPKQRRVQPRAAAAAGPQAMEAQLAAAEREEAEAMQREAKRQAEEAAFAARQQARREEMRVEAIASAARREAAATKKAAAEVAAKAAAAEQQRNAQLAKERSLHEIEQQVKVFHAVFKEKHGRKPKSADLELACNTRMKVLVESLRYHLLKHGIVPSGLRKPGRSA